MAEAQFMPADRPGAAVDSAISGVEAGQSMMQRASNLRQSQQMEQLRQQQIVQNQVLMPVLKAKADADLVTAAASVATATRMQELRKKAGLVATQATDEFLAATQLADWDEQSAELARIQAKYGWMGVALPEYKPFLDAVDKARANSVTRSMTEQTLEASMERAKIASETRQAVVETQQTGATERTAMAAEAGVKKTEIATGSRESIASETRNLRGDLAKYKAAQQSAIQADKDAARASAAGDEANSAIYRRHAAEFRAAAEKELAAEAKPQDFTIPNVTDKPKLYAPPTQPGAAPSFTPAVKTPDDVIEAMQQMVDDGIIDAQQARDTLKKLGFKAKGG